MRERDQGARREPICSVHVMNGDYCREVGLSGMSLGRIALENTSCLNAAVERRVVDMNTQHNENKGGVLAEMSCWDQLRPSSLKRSRVPVIRKRSGIMIRQYR
jgi:hypothetical protein